MIENILVTGANGQLGTELRMVSKNSDDRYFFTDVAELDITNQDAVENFVKDNNITIIINCAGYTNVDKAEEDHANAELVNVKAVANLARSMRNVDGTLIHISTDYVFGGSAINRPIMEDDTPAPLGVYGMTKLAGEHVIHETGCRHIILRTAWLYSEYGHNFLKTMLNLTSTKNEIKVVFDQIGTPTYALDLAKVIFDIVENDKLADNLGTYNYTNEGVCSWFDFTKMIAKIAGNNNCNIKPCHSSEYKTKAMRPPFSVLDKTKFKDTFNVEIPYWTDSLKQCISNITKVDK